MSRNTIHYLICLKKNNTLLNIVILSYRMLWEKDTWIFQLDIWETRGQGPGAGAGTGRCSIRAAYPKPRGPHFLIFSSLFICLFDFSLKYPKMGLMVSEISSSAALRCCRFLPSLYCKQYINIFWCLIPTQQPIHHHRYYILWIQTFF